MTARSRQLVVAAAVILLLVVAGTLLFRRVPDNVSAPLFILVVIIEVIIAPIPGGAIGYMGAARFGFVHAWPLLYIGNAIGTTIVFFLARRIGAPIFQETVSTASRQRYDDLLRHHPVLLWLAYAIPLIPLDVLSVLAGLSTISARRFLLTACTGYIVYTGIVAYIGSSVAQLIGVTETLSLIGAVLLFAVLLWLWQKGRAPRMLRVALTGNIASGKSAVAAIWQERGAAVIEADELARRAVDPGTRAFRAVVRRFGDRVLAQDGTVDRAALRAIVFADEESRRALEAMVHPEVEQLRQEAERRVAAAGARVVVHSIPLLFETGLDDRFDVIVLVDAPEAVRHQRIVDTRGLDDSEAAAMIAAQMPAALKRARSHYVIDNDGDQAQLRERAEQVWGEIEARVA